MNELPRVFLVGAGPGHPGLLTLRAVECLSRADFILYDRLVPERLLDHVPPGAERLCVDLLPGPHSERCRHIQQRIIDAAKAGKRVVRLQGGDPFLFGRGGEVAAALREAGIPYEIVPGVTSGISVPAFAGIPVTHRQFASAVAFVTGHEQPDKPGNHLDWAALACFPGTLVIFMPLARLELTAAALIRHGKPPDTPAAIIASGSTPSQQTVEATLATVAQAACDHKIHSPALVVVGPVATLRRELAWFESRPLFGKRVLITRPRHQTAEMGRRLEELGAETFLLPILDVCEPSDWGPVDRAIADLGRYQWLVFTSTNGVDYFLRRLRQTGHDLRALGSVKLAAIGPETGNALRRHLLEPDLIPAEYSSEGLIAALREKVRGQRVLLARADRGRELLQEELRTVAEVEQVAVYSQIDLEEVPPAIGELLSRGEIDFVTVTSSNIARGLARLLTAEARAHIEAGRTQLVSISPVTSADLRRAGLEPRGEATEYTTAGVVEAMVRLASSS